jgi:hypothetical protein
VPSLFFDLNGGFVHVGDLTLLNEQLEVANDLLGGAEVGGELALVDELGAFEDGKVEGLALS